MKKRIITILSTICLLFIFSIFSSALSLGDVDCNGNVNAADARLALRFSAKIETPKNEEQKLNADLNFDNQINASDARTILRISAKLESLPSPPSIKTDKTMDDLTKDEIESVIEFAQINCSENYTKVEKALISIDVINNVYPTHIENRSKYIAEYNEIYAEYNDIKQEGQEYIESIDSQVEELKEYYLRKAESAGQRAYQNVMGSGGTGSSSSKKAAAERAYSAAYQNEYSKVNSAIDTLYETANQKIASYNTKLEELSVELDTIITQIDNLNYYIEKCETDYETYNQIINDNLNIILNYIRFLLEEDYEIIDVPISNQELYEKFVEIAE